MDSSHFSSRSAGIQPTSQQDTAIFLVNFHKKMEQETAAFQELHPAVLAEFKGQFIALSEGTVIDHDFDEMKLAKRISLLPKSRFILIERVF